MVKKCLACVMAMSVMFMGVGLAAPVRLPMEAKKDRGVLASFGDGKSVVSVGAEYDNVSKLKLDGDNGEVEFSAASGVVSLTYDERVGVYGVFGQVMDPKNKFDMLGSQVEFRLEDKFMWGVGANAVLAELKGVKLFTDINYRQVDEMDYDSVSIDGTSYSRNDVGAKIDASFKEFQTALGVSKAFTYATPYAGVTYSYVKTSANVTVLGTTYDLGSAKNDSKVGVFTGAVIKPLDFLDINVQGRFVNETAVMVSATFKF